MVKVSRASHTACPAYSPGIQILLHSDLYQEEIVLELILRESLNRSIEDM